MSPTLPKLADPLAVIRGGELPKRVAPVCFATGLVQQYEALQQELLDEARQSADSLGGGRKAEIRAALLELEDAMRERTVELTLQAIPRPRFKELKRKHPPRKDEDGKPNARDARFGVNEETFFDSLLRESIVDPPLDDETFRLMVDEKLSEAQFDRLTTIAWNLNEDRIDLPFSYAASRKTPNSEPA